MNDLFRFLIIRKPETPAAGAAIALAADTPLSNQLTQARSSADPLGAMQRAADAYLQSGQAVQTAASLASGPGLARFAAAAGSAATAKRLQAEVRTAFGHDAAQVASGTEFDSDQRRLSDTLLALPLASTAAASGTTGGEVLDMYRAAILVTELAQSDQTTVASGPADMRRPVLLPAHLFPLPTPEEQQPVPAPPSPGPTGQDEQAALAREAADVARALAVLAELPLTAATTPSPADASGLPQPSQVAHAEAMPGDVQLSAEISGAGARGVARGVGAVAPAPPSLLEQLPADTRRVITSLGSGVDTLPIEVVTSRLMSHYTNLVSQLSPGGIGWINGWDPTSEPAAHDDATDPPPAVLGAPPASHGTLQPAGIADLLVVRRHVLRYEPGEVAYVENVALAEDFQRVSKRTTSTQTTVTVDTTTSSSEERDTQATSRFDLNRQASSVLQADYGRVPGAATSESYGALVQSGGSKQDASSSATNFSQDITRRAASTIAEQFHMQTVTSTFAGFEEDVTHHFDNSRGAAAEHVVYQWLDKIDQAQVFSYGKRLLYDVMVPEPGSFLLRSLAHQQPDLLTLQKPTAFTLEAEQLDELNYLYFAAGYGATGVQPPPERYRTVSQPWNMDPTGNPVNTTRALQVTVPPGYAATKATVSVMYVFWDSPGFYVTVGQRMLHFGAATDPVRQSTALNGETGSLPLVVIADGGVFDCTVAVEILCTRTDQSLLAWKLQTHDVILQASRERLAEYESRWAMLHAALKLLSFGQGSARKRQLERAELQKAALAVLTNQQFDNLGAIEHSSDGYPQPFLPNVEPVGRYVRFLQQSFEWDQMMYLFYPYFWGRKPYWIDRVLLEDADDQFGDFIRAGSARVIVPVRPGFEGVVGQFMATGTVPTTAELGQLTSADYLPYLAELQGTAGGADTATPYGPAWEVRLPTSLTVARKDATLPRWKEQTDAQGHITWVSDGVDPVG